MAKKVDLNQSEIVSALRAAGATVQDLSQVRYLTDHGPSELQKIMGASDSCSPESARRAVYDLVDTGTVYRTNPDDIGQGAEAIYALKEPAVKVDDYIPWIVGAPDD